MKIPIKLLRKDSKTPNKQKQDDVGADAYINIFANIEYIDDDNKSLRELKRDVYHLHPYHRVACKLGFATEIPKGFYGRVVPRSGLALWKGITIANTPGTIDSGYRNEWIAIIVNLSEMVVKLKKGERICQVIIEKEVEYEFEQVDELDDSERGMGGFGSTGSE